MYRKYMHSNTRKTNPSPVHEGLGSWIKNKIQAHEEKVQAEKEAKRKEACAKRRALLKMQPKEGYAKIQAIVKKTLKDKEFAEFKNAKAIPWEFHRTQENRRFTLDEIEELDVWGDIYMVLYQIILPKITSSNMEDHYDTLLNRLDQVLNLQVEKLDKRYDINCWIADSNPDDDDSEYEIPGKSVILVSMRIDVSEK